MDNLKDVPLEETEALCCPHCGLALAKSVARLHLAQTSADRHFLYWCTCGKSTMVACGWWAGHVNAKILEGWDPDKPTPEEWRASINAREQMLRMDVLNAEEGVNG